MKPVVPYGTSTCLWCDAALSPHQAATTSSCGAPDCERKRIIAVSTSVTQRHLDEHDELRTRLSEKCTGALGSIAEAAGVPVGALSIGVVPYNGKGLAPLPEVRRMAFEAHLTKIAEEGFAVDEPRKLAAPEGRQSIDRPESPVTDAACATCLGNCCKAGGPSWAFLDVAEVCRFRVANPGADADAFRQFYLSFLPEESVPDNCVYQSGTGCTLERRDRASLCNSFLCRGVNRLLADSGRQAGTLTAIIAHEEGAPRAIGLFDANTGSLVRMSPAEEI